MTRARRGTARGGKAPAPKGRERGGLSRALRRAIVIAAAVLVGLPLGLLALYRFVPVPVTPLMIVRLTEGEGLSKDWVPLERIAPVLPAAVIAAEDNRFCEHAGVDFQAVWAALGESGARARLRGASTISMQTVKNLLLWPDRSYVRKGLEFVLTPLLEIGWTKRRIIEVYLNIVEWAPGVYGAEAAARHHFGKSAANLTRREAALLAVVLPNPREMSASRPSNYVARRARTIERRMGQIAPLLGCYRDRG